MIGRRQPTGVRKEQHSGPLGCLLVGVVVVAIVGGVLGWLVHHERSKSPAGGPLIFQGPK